MTYFGGKSTVAHLVWEALGNVSHYLEPFFGSGAVLLNRPNYSPTENTESVCDKNGFIANVWRAIQFSPDETAKWCDWPVNHCFCKGSKIEIPTGNIEIEKIRPGDFVLGLNNDGRIVDTEVLAVSHRIVKMNDLVSLGSLMATKDHPFWTTNGFKKAKNILDSQHIGLIISRYESKTKTRNVELRKLRNFFSTNQEGSALLFDKLCARTSAKNMENRSCRPREIKAMAKQSQKSNSQSDHPKKKYNFIAGTRVWMDKGPEANSRNAVSAETSLGTPEMAYRGCYKNKQSSRKVENQDRKSHSAIPIYCGHRGQITENRCGGGRTQSLSRKTKRCKKGFIFNFPRLDGNEIQKQRHFKPHGNSSRSNHSSRTVYNIQTKTGNYFVGQVLVHNCDLSARKRELIKNEDRLLENLIADPMWHDPILAGYWIYAASCWIGSGLTRPGAVSRLGGKGMGVHAGGKIPRLADKGTGVHAAGKRPHLSGKGTGVNIQNANIYEWFRALSNRLRYVRVVCGDWSRICGGDWQDKKWKTVGYFFDPPYAVADRDTDVYHHDSQTVGKDVEAWCLERGRRTNYRIVVAGYEGEYLELIDAGWRVHHWKATGGYGNQAGKKESQGKTNRHRERLFFSPNCLSNGLFD